MKTLRLIIFTLLFTGPFISLAQPGAMDMTFADNAGIKYINFLFSDEEWMTHSVIDSQDRIWMAGSTTQGGDGKILLVRLTPDGQYDPTFSDDGNLIIDIADNNTENVHGITMQGDKVIVAGRTIANGVVEPFVLRCTPAGGLDPQFGTMGILSIPVPAAVADVAVDNEDNIYVTGMAEGNILVIKILPDGDFDDDFGFFGATLADFASTDEAAAISVDEAGNIFVFGNGLANGVLRGHISSFLPTGAINTNFTITGRRAFTWPDDGAFSVSDGFLSADESRFYLAGSVFDGSQLDGAIIAVHYESDIIEDFGTDGFWKLDASIGGNDIVSRLIEGPDGLYASLLLQEIPTGINTAIAHIDADGLTVEEFGENGSGWATYNISVEADDQPTGLGLQSDGRLVATGIALENPEAGISGYTIRILTEADDTFVSEQTNKAFTVWPNPATDGFWMDADNEAVTGQGYQIYNGLGQQVQIGIIDHQQHLFDISQFPDGVYHLVVGNRQATRIIKRQ